MRSRPLTTEAHHPTRAADKPYARLLGKSFLVVEDEPLVALDIVAGLKEAGGRIVRPFGTVQDALNAIENAALDAARLDGSLRGQPVDEIAAALAHRRVPFFFVTGYGLECLPPAFANTPMLSKPFNQQATD